MDNRIRLGKVHIVEWLDSDDMRTGRDLYGELEPMGIMSRPEVKVAFHSITARAQFITLLRAFEDDFRASGCSPILHIETHGSRDGIGACGEGLEWRDLMEELIPLNRLTRLNLVVVLSACEGVWGVKMLQPDRRAAAFRGLIGPNRPMLPEELATGIQTFYRKIFSEHDGDVAFKAMNDAIDPAKPAFSMVSAEFAFKLVYQHYLKGRCAPEEVDRRAATIAAKVAARVKAERGIGMFHHEIGKMTKDARQYLGAHAERFEEMRREFFFIDLYAENDARFNFTIDDCRPVDD